MSAPRWKETKVRLRQANVLIIDGPGDEWLVLCRGQRATNETPAAPGRPQPRRAPARPRGERLT